MLARAPGFGFGCAYEFECACDRPAGGENLISDSGRAEKSRIPPPRRRTGERKMTPTETQAQVERVLELFPGATPEHGVVLLERLQAFDREIVSVAITNHAATHRFLDVKDLLDDI